MKGHIMRRTTAFTLIELLVVVSVIGLLTAILVPSFGSARRQAKRVACGAHLKQVGIAMAGYLSDSNDRLPRASSVPSIGPGPLGEAVYIADVLGPYVDSQDEVFHCPADLPGRFQREAPNAGRSWFQSERSSYQYRVQLAGRTMTEVANLFERMGRTYSENTIYVMRDFNNFHGKDGDTRKRNYLYIDGHVSDFENF